MYPLFGGQDAALGLLLEAKVVCSNKSTAIHSASLFGNIVDDQRARKVRRRDGGDFLRCMNAWRVTCALWNDRNCI